jgi:hypothetical protein
MSPRRLFVIRRDDLRYPGRIVDSVQGFLAEISRNSDDGLAAPKLRCQLSRCGQPLKRISAKGHVALPPKADMCSALAYVRFGPIADIAHHLDGGLVGTTSGFAHRRDRENELEQRPILAVRRRSKLATVTLGNPAADSQS